MGQTGVTALTLVGTVVGSYFGGPIGGAVGGMAGGLIGSMIFGRTQKPLIPDWQLAGSSYGHVIPTIYGQARLPANFIWESPIQVKQHGIGKGMTSSTSYWQSAALAFCNGEATLLKIWTDGILFFDATSTDPHELTKYTFAMRTYNGTEDQLPDPLIQTWVEENVFPQGACPAYRGLCYIVMQQLDTAHYGNRFPNITALWSSQAVESTVYVPLVAFTDDVSSDLSFSTASVVTDWVRRLVTSMSLFDPTFRVYDMVSGSCIAAKTWAQVWAPEAVPTERFSEPPRPIPPQAIAASQGGYLYIVASTPFDPQYILTLDPGSLQIIRTVTMTDKPAFDYITSMVPVTFVDPTGQGPNIDLLICSTGPGGVFIVDPTGGNGAAVGAFEGIGATTNINPGAVNEFNGEIDLWIVASNVLGVNTELNIFTGKIYANSAVLAVDLTLAATLTPADFGLPPTDAIGGVSCGTLYDPSDNTLIISLTAFVAAIKWSPAVGVVWLQSQLPFLLSSVHAGNTYFDIGTTGVYADRVGVFDFTVVNSASGTFVTANGGTTISGSVLAYSSTWNAAVTYQNTQLYIAYLQRQAAGEIPVADIIVDLCAQVDVTADMVDVTQVTATTIGYTINSGQSVRQSLADLCQVYQIDMVESDYVLKFVPRGQPPVANITQAQLAPLNPSQPGTYWEEKRAQQQELPQQVNIRYIDPAFDYQPSAAYAKRTALPIPTQFTRRVQTVDLPVVANNLEARQIAEKWLYTLWAERDTYSTMLGQQFLYLDPTDNVVVYMDSGDRYVTRIESLQTGADYTQSLQLAAEDASVYAVSATMRGASVSFVPQTVTPDAFVQLLQFNVPLLQDSDDLGGTASRIYFAGGPTSTVPPTATAILYQSSDTISFNKLTALAGFAAWGHTQNALGDTVAPFSTDTINTLTVRFAKGSALPTSCSYLDLMNGVNPLLVGSEIIQFGTVLDNADGTVTLSQLVRGRRGTEWATSLHVIGEVVVLLVQGQIGANQLPLGEINSVEFYKLVPSGWFLDQIPTNSWKYLGYDLFPYAPVQLARAPSGSDLVLSWLRRTRIGGLLVDGTDTVPLNEETEAYEVYLIANAAARAAFDPTNVATYVRAFKPLTSPTCTYTAAEMTTDGFTPATQTLFMIVYQLSAITGRGFQGYAALPAF